MIRVSVVVPTFNRAARLPALIAALEAQTLPSQDFEVIVADNGSEDQTKAVLADLRLRSKLDLQWVSISKNSGCPAPARNLAWRTARAPVVAFTDDDCLPSPRWLEAGLAKLEGSGVGIVQGRTLPDPSVPLEGWWRSIRVEEFSHRYETCNVFYRTDVLEAVGGFDEGAHFSLDAGLGGEDVDIGWKARRLGVAAEFAPEALVHHAVTHAGLAYHFRCALRLGNWPLLVRRFPEMRRELLFYRVFMGRRHIAFLAGVAGIAAAPFWLPALGLAAPYAVLFLVRNPPRFGRREIISKLLEVPFDAAVISGLVIGSIRERTLVL